MIRSLLIAAMFCGVCSACAEPAQPGGAPDTLVVTRLLLPPLPSRISSASSSVNDNGVLVGRSWSDPTVWDRGTRWEIGVAAADVGPPGDSIIGPTTAAVAINDSGRIVGYYSHAYDDNYALQWDPAGRVDTLGPGIAYALNSSGQSAGCYQAPPIGQWKAVVWSADSEPVYPGTLGGDYSCANAINDSGWVAGSARTAAGVEHAFLWKPTTGMIDLGSIYNISRAYGLNNRGEVVGVTGDDPERPFYWTAAHGMVELPTLPLMGDPRGSGIAYAINDSSEIVGYSSINTLPSPGYESAILWRSPSDAPLNLTALVGRPLGLPLERVTIARALAISRSGLIAGWESDRAQGPGAAFPKAALWRVEIHR